MCVDTVLRFLSIEREQRKCFNQSVHENPKEVGGLLSAFVRPVLLGRHVDVCMIYMYLCMYDMYDSIHHPSEGYGVVLQYVLLYVYSLSRLSMSNQHLSLTSMLEKVFCQKQTLSSLLVLPSPPSSGACGGAVFHLLL